MSATDFPWLRPRTIGLDADTLGKVRAYEAQHSLPGYRLQLDDCVINHEHDGSEGSCATETELPGYPDEVEAPPTMRDRILAEIHTLRPLPPCEEDEPGPDIDCLTCEDTGFCTTDHSNLQLPCPECPRGDWTWGHELNDDARRGK